MDKGILYKVYDESDAFVGVLTDVVSDFKLPQQINSPGSTITLELARNADSLTPGLDTIDDDSDDPIEDSDGLSILAQTTSVNQIGPGSVINHNYRVDIFVFFGLEETIDDSSDLPIEDSAGNDLMSSAQAADGRRLFTGFISDIDINYGGSENTVITLASYGYDLDQYVVEDTGDTTVAFNSYDPSDIIKDGLDVFYAAAGTVNYDVSTIDTTGSTVSYTFNTNTYLELIQKALELAPSDWYWYLDMGTNLINFRERPATPDHYFYLGKHLESIDVKSSILEVANDVLYSGGDDGSGDNIFVRRTQAVAANTRRGLRRSSDNRVTTTAAAEIIADGELERYGSILYRTNVTIMAPTYIIENIKVGDLVGFRNFGNYVDTLEMQVVSSNYELDSISLELGTLLPRVNKRIEDIKRQLILQETEENPAAPS